MSEAEDETLTPDERTELERLRAETAELHKQQAGAGRRRRISWRTPVAIVLIFVGCLLAPEAVLGVWAANQVSDTGRYVANVEPLIHDPAIQNALTDKITNQITSRLNVTGVINQASAQLNSKGLTRISSLLDTFGPQIASSVTGFVHSTVHSVVSSPAFATAWVQVNTVAHAQIVKVLSGQGNSSISVSNGQVVIGLGPFIDIVKKALVDRGFTLANSIPAINPTIALFQARQLERAQSGYRLINTLKIVLPILTLLFIAAGVYVARSHRRALIGAGLGFAFSMLFLGVDLQIFRSIYLNSVPAARCQAMPLPPCSTRSFGSSRTRSAACWCSGWSSPPRRSSPGPPPRRSGPAPRSRRGWAGSGAPASVGVCPPGQQAAGPSRTAKASVSGRLHLPP